MRRRIDTPPHPHFAAANYPHLPLRGGIEIGMLDRVFEAVAAEPDLEWVMLDATVIRAHAQAAGARLKSGARTPRRLIALAAASEPSFTSA